MSLIFSLTRRQGSAKLHAMHTWLNKNPYLLQRQPTSFASCFLATASTTSRSKVRTPGYTGIIKSTDTGAVSLIHQKDTPLFQNNYWNHNNDNGVLLKFIHTDTVKSSEKSVALVHVLKEIRSSPAPALILGLSGLVPFVAVPCFFLHGGTFVHDLAIAQLAYGATILSFLGGVRWGFTLPDSVNRELTWRNLGWSVTPSLLAWSALLMPYTFGSLTLIAGLGGAAYLDLMYEAYPTWFKALRFCLSLIAVLSLWTSLVLSFILRE